MHSLPTQEEKKEAWWAGQSSQLARRLKEKILLWLLNKTQLKVKEAGVGEVAKCVLLFRRPEFGSQHP